MISYFKILNILEDRRYASVILILGMNSLVRAMASSGISRGLMIIIILFSRTLFPPPLLLHHGRALRQVLPRRVMRRPYLRPIGRHHHPAPRGRHDARRADVRAVHEDEPTPVTE